MLRRARNRVVNLSGGEYLLTLLSFSEECKPKYLDVYVATYMYKVCLQGQTVMKMTIEDPSNDLYNRTQIT